MIHFRRHNNLKGFNIDGIDSANALIEKVESKISATDQAIYFDIKPLRDSIKQLSEFDDKLASKPPTRSPSGATVV